jgi:sigma-B regulation protein RsbQ
LGALKGTLMTGVIERNSVKVRGAGERAMVFAHGHGCDQHVAVRGPAFEENFKTVLFDHVGAGSSDLRAYDRKKYSTLGGYADDVVEIGHEMDLHDAVFVGHSVSSMIGVLASLKAAGMFGKLVLIGPSAATSTTRTTSADSAQSRSMNFWTSWNRTTWGGRPRWRR